MPDFVSPTTPKPFSLVAFSLGLFLFALYLLSYRGGFHSIDEVSTFAVTENLVKFGRFNTNQIAWSQWVTTQAEAQGFFGLDGQVYSKKGLALSLAQSPLYWLALELPGLGMVQTVSLLNAILTAWTAALLYAMLRRLNFSTRTALVTALLYGTGTVAWVYAKYLFSETLAGFLLALTSFLLLVYKQQGGSWRLALAGFCAGLAVLTRANNILLFAVFGLYLLSLRLENNYHRKSASSNPQSPTPSGTIVSNLQSPIPKGHAVSNLLPAVALFAGGAMLAGGIFAWYNWLRSGNPLQTGYDLSIFSPNVALGVYKLLFSPLRGLFIYSPLLSLAIPGWFKLRKLHPQEAWLSLGLVGVTVFLFSAWTSGEGLSWGSRFLVPVVPFLMLALAPIVEDFPHFPGGARLAILILALISIGIQILGVAINPWVYLNQLQTQFGGEFFLERTAALTDFSTSQIWGQLRHWQVTNSDLAWWQPSGFDGLAFGLSLGLVCLTAWFLKRSVDRRSPLPDLRLVAATGSTVLVTLVAVGLTFFLLARYYRTDRQFGSPDSPYIQALNRAAEAYTDGDKLFTVAQYDYHVPMNRFKGRIPLTGFAQNEGPLPQTAYSLLGEASFEDWKTGRIWLITVGRQPAEPANRVEAWLAQHAFKASDTWLGQTRLVHYGLPCPGETTQVDETLGQAARLIEVDRPLAVAAGGILPVTLTWQAVAPLPVDYTVFLQLIAAGGHLAAQHDGPPQGGYLPTSQWPVAEPVADRRGLLIPATLSPGDYRLIVGLYNPADGSRLLTAAGPDFIDLGAVRVTP